MPHLALDQPLLDHAKRVLIIDRSADSRDVLRLALERRGVTIFESPDARQGLDMLRQHRPEVIVLDLEAEAADDAGVRAAYDDEMAAHRAEMVILGNLRRDQLVADQHLVPKPYHYGPLIETIERLVQRHAAAGS